MIKKYGIVAAIAVSALGSTGASAATVVPPPVSTLEIVGVSGEWMRTTDGDGVTGRRTDAIQWGIPYFDGGAKSGYSFDGVETSAPQQPETDFRLGTFIHDNRVIDMGTSITAARLRVSFQVRINDVTNGLSRLVSAISTFDFRHWETPNNDPLCADGAANGVGVNVNGCADRVSLDYNPSFSDTFRLGKAVYTLDISGFDGGADFWTIENASNRSNLFGRFTTTPDLVDPDDGNNPAPIPLPAAGWFLLAGLGALGGLARRKSRTRR